VVNGIHWFPPPCRHCANPPSGSYPLLGLILGCQRLASCKAADSRSPAPLSPAACGRWHDLPTGGPRLRAGRPRRPVLRACPVVPFAQPSPASAGVRPDAEETAASSSPLWQPMAPGSCSRVPGVTSVGEARQCQFLRTSSRPQAKPESREPLATPAGMRRDGPSGVISPASPYSSSKRKSVSRPVSRVLYGAASLPHVTAIHLGRPLPGASRNQPGRLAWKRAGPLRGPRRPYSVLLPVGFTVPLPLPVARWALTPPFHPYRGRSRGGLLSVALSLGSPPPGVTRHRFSVEPGLSSPAAFPHLQERPSSRLTRDW